MLALVSASTTLSLHDRNQLTHSMPDQINSLNQRIATLEQQLADTQADAEQYRRELARRQRQLDLLTDLGTITTGTDQALEALEHVLRFICNYMDWPVGHVWLCDPHRHGHMASSEIWFNQLPNGIDDFQRASRQTTIDADSGFLGQALSTGQPVWAPQLAERDPSPRNTSAAQCGLCHALACPIGVTGGTAAILEFYSKTPIPESAGTKEIIRQLTVHLARLFELQQATTVRELYTEQLERNAEQLSRLAHIGSHDLQEPLRKIELFMTRLQRTDGAGLSKSGMESLNKITAASTRMSALIRDLLELVYVATDHWHLTEVDLDRMLGRIREVRTRRELAPEDEFEIDALPVLWAEPEVTRQVFEELIDNAIQYRSASRPLRIRVGYRKDDGDFNEISIEDNGIGFQPDYAELIFKPFQLLQRDESEQHTGVGLALCRRAIERLGGRLTARSEGPGTGACFTIRLPHTALAEDPAQNPAPPLFRASQPDATPD